MLIAKRCVPLSIVVIALVLSGMALSVQAQQIDEAIDDQAAAWAAAERRLMEYNQRLVRAERIAKLGHWEFHLNDNTVVSSPGARAIYGVTTDELTIADAQRIPLPEYRERLDEALRALIADGQPYDMEFRIRRPDDGAIAHIHSIAEYDADRHVVFGSMLDITAYNQTLATVKRQRDIIVLIGGLFLIAGLVWVFLVHRALMERKAAQDLGKRRERDLETTLQSIGDAVIATDTDGMITRLNRVCETLTGWTAEEAVGRRLEEVFQIVHAQTREPAVDPVKTVLTTGNVVGLANHTCLLAKDGTEYHIADSAAPIIDEYDNINGVILVFRDVSAEYQAREELQASEARFRGLFENSLSGLILHEVEFSPEGDRLRPRHVRQLKANQAYYDIVGEPSTDQPALGAHWNAHLTDLCSGHGSVVWEEYRPSLDKHLEMKMYTLAQHEVVTVVHDITQRKRSEERAKEWHDLMEYIIHHDPNAITVLDEGLTHVFASQRFLDDYGVCKEDVIGRHHYDAFPDIPDTWREVHQRALAGEALSGEDEYVRHDGSLDYTRWECRPWFGQDGRIGGIVLYTEVITKSKQAEAEITRRRQELEGFFTVALDLLCIADTQGNFHRVNKAWSDVLGYGTEELEQRNFLDFVHTDDRERTIEAMGALERQQPVLNFVNRYRDKHGRHRYIEWRAYPLDDRIYAAARDITEKIERERELRHLTLHDSLTGLHNRRFMEEELQRFNQSHLSVSLIMADLNGLKMVNDSLGHFAGDRVLKNASKVIRTACREQDTVARWGGDEFVVLLPSTDEQEAEKVCARILRLSEEAEEEPVKLSISLGSSTRTKPGKDIMEVLKDAEDDMYRHKNANTHSSRSALVRSLQRTLQEKSHETEQHARNMQRLAVTLGQRYGLAEREVNELGLLAILHDLGKVAIPESILTKPSGLTEQEWKTMREHPDIGYRIALASPDLVSVAEGIRCHHERWDGTGYPRGLREEQIPLIARIVAIVDAYEAMTSDRHYRSALDQTTALEEIKRGAGTQFDPTLAELFLTMMRTGEIEAAATK